MNTKNLNGIKNLLLSNLSARQTIFKNTFWLTVSTAGNKLLSLALLIYAARILGAEGYGRFTFALAFASLLMIFADFGLASIVTREFAREEEKKEEFHSLLSLKILLALATFILILLASFFVAPAPDTRIMILILALFLLVNGLIDVCYSFFHARQKMEHAAFFEIFQALMMLVFGLFVLFRLPSPANLSFVYLISSLATMTLVLTFFHFKIFALKIKWDFAVWKKFLKMSWPLALMGLFGAIYSYTDSVMLGFWGMMKETGWYNASYRIVTASLVPMGLIGASFYPALSKFSKESKEKLQKAFDYELEVMLILALPLMAGGIALAQKIIYSFYPADFAPAAAAFQILILTAGIIFIYRPFYDIMIVLNQQQKTFWITIVGALANVVLNLILIPKYSLYGAATATLITNSLVLSIMMILTKKSGFIRLPFLRIFPTFLISAFSSVLMFFAVRYLSEYDINIFISVITGALIYFLAFFGIKKYILTYA